MIQKRFFLLVAVFAFSLMQGNLINLEDRAQDFVLYTKQIHVPGYPDAYNPSIIRFKGNLLMSFRITPDYKRKYDSEIGVVFLDEHFNAISTPQILSLFPVGDPKKAPPRAEDGRLVVVDDTLYLIYDDNRDKVISRGGFRVFVAELEVKGQKVTAKNIEKITTFEGESKDVREKGWIPFEYENTLKLIYSISPTLIFDYVQGTGSCKTFAKTHPKTQWKWGVLRGGTAAVKIDDAYYLSFFHSSIEMKTLHSGDAKALHYFMGAYLFSSQPPFRILAMSPEPIIGKNFYEGKKYKPYHHPVCAVFPGGYLWEEPTVFVFYGRQDHEIWVVALDKMKLLSSLKLVYH